MRKLILIVLFALLVIGSVSATATVKTYLTNYMTLTDVGLDATPADKYATGTDAVLSDKFPGLHIGGKQIVALAYVKEAANGTSANHLTPIMQVSGDGTTWADVMTLEAYSSAAVAATTTWAMVIDLTGIYAPYFRIAYIIHTSAHAVLADASTGDIKTIIYTVPNK